VGYLVVEKVAPELGEPAGLVALASKR